MARTRSRSGAEAAPWPPSRARTSGGSSQSGRPTSGRSRRAWRLTFQLVIGQLLDEDDLAGHLLVGQRQGDVLAELGLELLGAVCAGPGHDERADELATALEVPDADDGRGCGNRGMAGEHALDVERAERPAARRDDVLGTTDEREDAVLVDLRDVAGEVPVAEERGLRLFGELPVAGEERRRPTAHGEVALDARRELVALVVDDRDVVAG